MSDLPPSTVLRDDEVLSDLLVAELADARLIGVLATFDPDGFIHAIPMWYAADGQAFVFATSSRSRKVRNVEADARATLVLHDSRPGYEVCGASIAGTVEIVRPPAARALIERVQRRYVAVEASVDPAARSFLESDDVALRLTPSTAVIWDLRDTEAAQLLRTRGWARPLVPTTPRE